MNVNKAHGCLLLAVGTPVILVGILGLSIELSEKATTRGISFALLLLLMGTAGIISAIWLFVRARHATDDDAASVNPATAKATIKAWAIVGFVFAAIYTVLAVWGFAGDLFTNVALSWSVLITGILFWGGSVFALQKQYSTARICFLIGGILGLPLAVPMIIGGKRIQLAGQALARSEAAESEPLHSANRAPRDQSAFADHLVCKHCGAENLTDHWPTEGDTVPFAYEAEPGNFNLKVHCSHCESDWYVVWDENPGSLEPLALPSSVQSAI